MNMVYAAIAMMIGAGFAFRPAINAVSSRLLGSPVAAAAVSIAITFVALLALLPLAGGTLRPSALSALPWWVVFAGLIGASVVAGGAWIVPVTGVAVFMVAMIAGQLTGSALIDQFGLFGLEARPVGLLRFAGLMLVLVGVALVQADS